MLDNFLMIDKSNHAGINFLECSKFLILIKNCLLSAALSDKSLKGSGNVFGHSLILESIRINVVRMFAFIKTVLNVNYSKLKLKWQTVF